MSDAKPLSRRPLASRDIPFFRALAAGLARAGIAPNAISFLSIVFAVGAAVAFAATAHLAGWPLRLCWLGAGCGIQLRLIANMLDGMVAVEGGKGGPTGELWNEAPDRVADAAIFIGAGWAAGGGGPLLGFGAALAAVFVAYVRALGASVGAGQIFIGPQAKPHRMFVMTLVSVVMAAVPEIRSRAGVEPLPLMEVALWIVIVGCAVTAWRRLARISASLRGREAK
jgi:phosphatidylglycerophosphate synthase